MREENLWWFILAKQLGLPDTCTPKRGHWRSKRSKPYKGGHKRKRLIPVKFTVWHLWRESRDCFTKWVLLITVSNTHRSSRQCILNFSLKYLRVYGRLNNRNDIVRLCHTTNNKAEYGQSRKAGHLSTLGQCLPDGGHVFKKEDMSSFCRTSGNPSDISYE